MVRLEIKYLLKNKYVRKLLNLVRNEGKSIVRVINDDLKEEIEAIFKSLNKSNRGRPPVFKPEQLFSLVIYALANKVKYATEIARKSKDVITQVFCDMEMETSHDTVSRFLRKLVLVIKEIFRIVVRYAVKLGVIDGKEVIMDGTDIPTKFKSDPTAKWICLDEEKGEYVWGNGGLIVYDTNHIPIAGKLTADKRVDTEDIMEVVKEVFSVVRPERLYGDGEFDIITLHNFLEEERCLAVIRYNPRNTRDPPDIFFRVELEHPELDAEKLRMEYRTRVEGEHAISVMKDQMGLRYPPVKTWAGKEAWLHLRMMLRVLYAIALHKKDRSSNLRCVTSLI